MTSSAPSRPTASGVTAIGAFARVGMAIVVLAASACAPSVNGAGSKTALDSPIRTFEALEAHAAFAATDEFNPKLGETGALSITAPDGAFIDGRKVDKNTSRALPRSAARSSAVAASFDGEVSEQAARCPEEMALIGERVCVDRWEASLVRTSGAGKGAHEEQMTPFESVDGTTGYRAVSRPNVVPQGYISGREAETACRASGKRLCTAGEWQEGCRGGNDTQFPYGNERRAHVCNDDIRPKHPVIEAVAQAGLPRDQTWKMGMNLPLINQLPDSLLPTGDRSECVTPEGLFDMVGNLHEWVADADGTFRGGYYMDTSQNGEGCSYQTTAHEFDYHDYSTGFRCCSDPDSIE